MLKQFELTQIGPVASKEEETRFELCKEKQSLAERIKGLMSMFNNSYVDPKTPDRYQSSNDVFNNGVTKLL